MVETSNREVVQSVGGFSFVRSLTRRGAPCHGFFMTVRQNTLRLRAGFLVFLPCYRVPRPVVKVLGLPMWSMYSRLLFLLRMLYSQIEKP